MSPPSPHLLTSHGGLIVLSASVTQINRELIGALAGGG
jgi:hypothetical protein